MAVTEDGGRRNTEEKAGTGISRGAPSLFRPPDSGGTAPSITTGGRYQQARQEDRETLDTNFARLHRTLAIVNHDVGVADVPEVPLPDKEIIDETAKAQILVKVIAHIRHSQDKKRQLQSEIERLQRVLQHLEDCHFGDG